jgi:hypothetical protein
MAPPVDPAFETARDQIAQRLETWQPPEGADPAEAAALKARLAALVDRFQPQPGQSTEDAIAALRDEFELRVDTFVQGERVDALVDEQTREVHLVQIEDAVNPDPAAGGMPGGMPGVPTDPTATDPAAHDDGQPGSPEMADPNDPATREELLDQIQDAVTPDGLYDPFDEMVGQPAPAGAVATATDAVGDGVADAAATPDAGDIGVMTAPAPAGIVAGLDDDILGAGAVADAVSGATDGGAVTAPTNTGIVPPDLRQPFEADPLGLPAPDQPVVGAPDDDDLDLDLPAATADDDAMAGVPSFDDHEDDGSDFSPDPEPEPDLSLPPDPADDDPSFL